MKISPSNQTLILASERPVQGNSAPNGALSQALDAASSGGVLRRLTIVAARPDQELVYVHADYAQSTSSTAQAGQALVLVRPATVSTSTSGSRSGTLSTYLAPVEQYALIQRNGAPRAASAGIDLIA